MPTSPLLVRLLSLIAIILQLTSCFSTAITPQDAPNGLEKLVAVSDSTIPVKVDVADLGQRTLGYQYLLMFIPISRVYLPSVADDLSLQLSVACGMRGFNCTSNLPSRNRSISITVRELSVNGYDLLVVRKPTASITIAAQLIERGQVIKECTQSFSATNTAHYAFDAELQHAVGEAFVQVSYKLLDCLELNVDHRHSNY